jgi:hypothetical protein
MGVDFVRKAARAFHKGLDKSRVELATPDLFAKQTVEAPRTYAAAIHDGVAIAAGEKLGVRLDGKRVVAYRGLSPVATFTNPPADLMSALTSAHGEAYGCIQNYHSLARTAEMTVS